ncbi:MAG: hypothetical protein JRI44_02665 [Deltaproteobacteria bacterium]|nr:hypothetical protein [Deltaproteobacteria bacterium]
MTVLNFLIAIVALIIAILAYQKASGKVSVQKIEDLHLIIESLREKLIVTIEKIESLLRKEEVEQPKTSGRKATEKTKKKSEEKESK